jgi:hypothetical protein
MLDVLLESHDDQHDEVTEQKRPIDWEIEYDKECGQDGSKYGKSNLLPQGDLANATDQRSIV